MTDRDSFVFYRSYLDAIEELPEKQQLRLLKAIAYKSLNGESIELIGVAKGMFALISPQIEANQRKYENGFKGAEQGKLGGRPRKSVVTEDTTEMETSETPKGLLPDTPMGIPAETPNVNVNVNVNENENDNDISPLPPSGGRDMPVKECGSMSKTLETRFDRFWEAYPHKVSRGQAMKTFAKLKPDEALLSTMLKAIELARRKDSRFREAQFTPHPATWLSGREWENVYAEGPQKPLSKPVSAQNYQQREYADAFIESHVIDFSAPEDQDEGE